MLDFLKHNEVETMKLYRKIDLIHTYLHANGRPKRMKQFRTRRDGISNLPDRSAHQKIELAARGARITLRKIEICSTS